MQLKFNLRRYVKEGQALETEREKLTDQVKSDAKTAKQKYSMLEVGAVAQTVFA